MLRRPWPLASALLLGLASSALAASTPPATMEALVASADAVVLVQVGRSTSFRHKGRVPIFTRTRLEVTETWKGAVPEEVDVVQAGGTLDGQTIVGHGIPALPEGATLVLFLFKHRTPFDGYGVVALEQGTFHVLRAADRRLWAARPGHGASVGSGTTAPAMSGATAPMALPLDELEARVRALAGIAP